MSKSNKMSEPVTITVNTRGDYAMNNRKDRYHNIVDKSDSSIHFIIETNVGEVAGLSGIWNPEGWPEPEVGWAVFDSFEGKSIAYEAACRARRWAYDELEFTTLTSGIVPNNQRSINLAKRMGAYFERSYTNLFMGEEMLFRHPKPHELHK